MNRNSLFTPLKAEGLTSLKMRYNFRTDKFRFFAAKEWDSDFDFAKFNKTFFIDDIFTDNAVYLNTEDVLNMYKRHGLEGYFQQVLNLVRAGKHFGIDCYYHDKYNIRFMMHEHSRKLGVLNKSQAIMAGGIRRHFPEEEELDVIIDGLNLGRSMSFKNIAGSLRFGGCKSTVTMGPLDIENREVMGFLAFALDSCRDMTGPDMNFPTEMSDVMIREGFSMQFTGGPNAKTGETGRPTAYGSYLSMKQAVKFMEGTERLDKKSIAVCGLGSVGWHMAEYLLHENVQLYISDINKKVVDDFISKHSEKNINRFSAEDFLTLNVDILCPCAIGGIITEDVIPFIKARYIWGPANNQLRASSQEQEIRLAKILDKKGILFVVEWWHNTAGVMGGAEEYLYNGTPETLNAKIEEILPRNTWEILNKAKTLGITPTECCYSTCEEILYV